MVTAADDEHLVRSAQAGDLASFNLLVERYQAPVYNLVLRYVADRHLAEDVTQEAFIAAWRAIQTFKGGSFRSWVFKIAVNEARDLHRRSVRRPASSLDSLLEEGASTGLDRDQGEGPEQSAISASTVRTVEECLRKLPEDQRIVVLLSDVQGLTYEEICDALGLPLGTVKSRLFRARGALRRLLIEAGELSGGERRLY